MATNKQNEQFKSHVFDQNLLDSSLEWIEDNLNPEDVFSDEQLINWAQQKKPDDIFNTRELEEWALNNGFVGKS